MQDVSAYLRSCFSEMHKKTMEKNYHYRNLRDRMDEYKGVRRQTRDTILLQKRNIHTKNLSPYNTPRPSKMNEIVNKKPIEQKIEVKPQPSNRQYEMLLKWKAEKEKKKQELKKKAKPVFKVCHVPVEIGLPDLEKVNKQIKGKPFISNFAPTNHKFRAPKNIKAIDFQANKPASSSENKLLQNTGPVRRIQTRKNTQIKSLRKTPLLNENVKSVKIVSNESKCKQPKKNVDWKVVNFVDSDDEVLKISDVPKKRYVATPKKKGVVEKINFPDNSKSSKVKLTKINSHTSDNKVETKKYNNSKETSKDSNPLRVTRRNARIVTPWKTREKINPEPPELLNKKVPSTPKYKKGAGGNNTTPASRNKFTPTKKKSRDEERETIYSDDEISIKTPRSAKISPRTPNGTLKTPSSTKQKGVGSSKYQERESIYSDDEISVRTPKTPKTPLSKPAANVDQPTIVLSTPPPRKLSRKRDTIYSDDEISIRTPKKTPKVTTTIPRSSRKVLISTSSIDSELTDDVFVDKNENKDNRCKQSNVGTSPVYISPYVTISRGKESARKEFAIRQSTGGTFVGTPDSKANFAESTTPKAAAQYFTLKLDAEISRLEGVCATWEAYKDQNALGEETIDMIDVAIGQSKLLIAKKFQQFRSLIEECRSCQYKEKPITCQDLHGFWDMIYMQVEDLDKRFSNLESLKANNWQALMPEVKVPVKRTRGRPRKKAVSSKLKDIIKAARSKKKDEETGSSEDSGNVETGVETAPLTPIRNRMSPFRPGSSRLSLRVSLLSGQVQKRQASLSPGLTMMRISQAIKSGDGLTPSKSILKTDLTRSERRATKSVLFKDDLVEKSKSSPENVNKENLDSSNMISFSPIRATRSRRSTRH